MLCTSFHYLLSDLLRVYCVLVKAIMMSKMTSHCAGTVQMREVRKRDKKVRKDVI